MNDGKISVRYAHAIFESALEKKLVDNVYRDMKHILVICTVPEFKEFLESPVIVPSKKMSILRKIFENNIEAITLSLLELTVRNGRESFLPGIARMFIHKTKEHKGITESVLTTAVKTNEKIKQQIIDLISGIFNTKVELEENIDNDIIGGFILKVEDSYIDASVRNKLRKIKKGMMDRTLSR